MARIRIDLPADFSFSTVLPVRVTDLNYGDHLGNHALLGLLHEARMQYLATAGASELSFFGASLIMSDAAIEYKGEGFYGDALRFEVVATEWSRVGFELYYRVTKDDGKTPIANAKTGMICFDYTARKVVSVPDVAKAALK
ncbi:acyl-CoA thioesterase [Flaviaesturariibacter aridisoli]|uniref:Thioesterase n=1 Tax=Flaviaesturariibacter aridisoli TaxID=2545761 RepID=A0A4V6P691_9BACT|nr:thioesterase family protein [Flaviaesturariibacter aridisoli]TCZ74522.1 thioesterase [Flaviaesturariibacter aridisoli]